MVHLFVTILAIGLGFGVQAHPCLGNATSFTRQSMTTIKTQLPHNDVEEQDQEENI